MGMIKKDFTIRFVTPAFLGDANQQGAWRTPPFKALLRQWWRVAAAEKNGFDHKKVREQEGLLFGHAWLKHGNKTWAARSQVLLRLDKWRPGTRKDWVPERKVTHPEVKRKRGINPDSLLYLGYGPLRPPKSPGKHRGPREKGTVLKMIHAVDEGETARLAIAVPEQRWPELSAILDLIQAFGTVGGRCRNGWGSFWLDGDGIPHPLDVLQELASTGKYARPLDECLKQDWPHALGTDDKGILCWRTKATFPSWQEAMKALAEIKIAFRTNIPFKKNRGKSRPRLDDRHLLAYPVTNRHADCWRNERLANQLRFKLVREGIGGFVGLAFHLPCGVPNKLRRETRKDPNDEAVIELPNQLRVWREVHQVLDQKMQRVGKQGGNR